ncbi:MAG: hypothetical protein Roseis2KO_44230 [Roseivirga sp.]
MLTPRILLICIILLYGNTKYAYTQNQIDSLKNLVSTLKGTEKIDAQYLLADRLVNVNPKEAMGISQDMIEQSDALGYQEGLAMAHHNLGAAYNLLSKLDSAILILEKGLAISEKLEDKIHEGRFVVTLSASYIRDYQLGKAQILLQKGLEIGAALGNSSMEMSCLMNMAVVHTYLKELPEAESNLLKALALAEASNAVLRIGQIYGNLGNLEFDRSNFSMSKDYFQKALAVFKQEGVQQMVSIVHTQLGRCHSELGELNAALQQFDLAYELRQLVNDQRGMASVLRYKSQSLLELRKWSEVEKLLNEGLAMNEKVRDAYISMDLAEVGYQLYEVKGDYQNAFKYHKEYLVFKDTIDSRNEREEVKRRTAEFDNAQLSQQLEQERKEKEIAELKKSQRTLLILLLLLFLLAAIVIYLVNRGKLRQKLIINEQEKALLNEKLANQSSKIDQIESELSSLEAEYSENAETKETLIQFLSGARVEGKDWASFKLLFEKIYPGVLAQFQEFNLTLNDQRLIALTVLGLSIKEIAAVLGITPKSVSKARTRLTGKLALDDTKNLDQFISGLIKVQNPPEQ